MGSDCSLTLLFVSLGRKLPNMRDRAYKYYFEARRIQGELRRRKSNTTTVIGRPRRRNPKPRIVLLGEDISLHMQLDIPRG